MISNSVSLRPVVDILSIKVHVHFRETVLRIRFGEVGLNETCIIRRITGCLFPEGVLRGEIPPRGSAFALVICQGRAVPSAGTSIFRRLIRNVGLPRQFAALNSDTIVPVINR